MNPSLTRTELIESTPIRCFFSSEVVELESVMVQWHNPLIGVQSSIHVKAPPAERSDNGLWTLLSLLSFRSPSAWR